MAAGTDQDNGSGSPISDLKSLHHEEHGAAFGRNQFLNYEKRELREMACALIVGLPTTFSDFRVFRS
ncbi:hypothetical protein ACFL6U_09445 [Planctomycetota bacterium]